MNTLDILRERVPLIEEKLGFTFKDKERLVLAFIHRSFLNENRGVVFETNERLEFLGDSVLGLIVSDYLFEHLPGQEEGQLSYLRAQLVESSHCALFLNQLDVGSYVLLGKGERMNDGRGRETILADLFEAIIGAIYLDGGLQEARRFFLAHFSKQIKQLLEKPFRNWKAELQDYCQKKYQKPPTYKVVKQSGPDHSKVFEVVVMVGEQEGGTGAGSSKKEAEQAAAQDALTKLSHG
jgi:ribonuclease-3